MKIIKSLFGVLFVIGLWLFGCVAFGFVLRIMFRAASAGWTAGGFNI